MHSPFLSSAALSANVQSDKHLNDFNGVTAKLCFIKSLKTDISGAARLEAA